MAEEPLKAVIFWPVVLLTIWGVWFATDGSGTLTVLAVIIMFGSLTGYYLPTHFTIDEQGVHLRRWFYRKTMGWEKIKSASMDKNGLFLSPFPVRTRLENYRGIYLPFHTNQSEIVTAIRGYSPGLRGLDSNA